MPQKVFIGKCADYDLDKIQSILEESFIYLDFQVPKNKTILLKPNVLGAYPPEKHITTNPIVVEAILKILLKNNNKVIIGDSSGVRILNGTSQCLKAAGITAVGEKYNVEVKSFDETGSKLYKNSDNKVLKEVYLTKLITEVDYIINLPKLKTHQLTRYTGAVKNFFGCVPGGLKQEYHARAPHPNDFADLILDIYAIIKPKVILNIMDGIIGLDGAGPGTSGHIKQTGILAVSKDAVALDMVCCDIIGVSPDKIPMNRLALNRSMASQETETNIEPEKVIYSVPSPPPIPKFFFKYFAFLRHKPVLIKEQCMRCSLCARSCPTQCISMEPYPTFNYKKCIRCYCCHENCPYKAIKLKDNLVLKLAKLLKIR